jgi:hypothetical protein
MEGMTRMNRLAVVLTAALVLIAAPVGTSTAQVATAPHQPGLVVELHQRGDVPDYGHVTYATAVSSGLTTTAAARADRALDRLVRRTLATIAHRSPARCGGGQTDCGYFEQTLTQEPCVRGYLCVKENVAHLPVGANDAEEYVRTLTIDTVTGRPVTLASLLPPSALPSLATAANTAIATKLASAGLAEDPLWTPHVTVHDLTAWLPAPDGIRLWFPKYDVAPGSFGVVTVKVPRPKPDRLRASTTDRFDSSGGAARLR